MLPRRRGAVFLQSVAVAILSTEHCQSIRPSSKRARVLRRQAWRNAAPTTINGPAASELAKPPTTAEPPAAAAETRGTKNNILPLKPQKKIDAATLTALVAAAPGDELDEPLRLVSGEIPKDLRGTLYVNGPARVFDGRGRAAHPLDGHGFVRAFSFGDGVTTVRGRFVRTWAYEIENFFDRNLFRGFFSLPFAPSTTVSKSPLVTFTPSGRHSDRDNVASIA